MTNTDKQFIVNPEIPAIGLKGIYFTIENIVNKDTDAEFKNYQREILQKAYIYASQNDLKQDSILLGFRHLHEAVGAPNRKNLSAPENLYKLLVKHGGQIPHINLLVDIYNTISVKYKLALGAHDLDKIDGNVHLRLTDGTEKYQPIGESEDKPVPAGHYSYIDDSNEVICYLDVRQVNKTAVNIDTTATFFVVQGNTETPIEYIKNATDDLIDQIKKYCGGKEKIIGIVK